MGTGYEPSGFSVFTVQLWMTGNSFTIAILCTVTVDAPRK